MTYNVLMGTLNPTHSFTPAVSRCYLAVWSLMEKILPHCCKILSPVEHGISPVCSWYVIAHRKSSYSNWWLLCLQSTFVRHNTPHPKELRTRLSKLLHKNDVDGQAVTHSPIHDKVSIIICWFYLTSVCNWMTVTMMWINWTSNVNLFAYFCELFVDYLPDSVLLLSFLLQETGMEPRPPIPKSTQ